MAEQQIRGPLMGRKGVDCRVLPVEFSKEICATPEAVRVNVETTLAQKYESFIGCLASPHGGTISIVGSAPSLHKHYHQVTGDVLACNAAHDFLLEKGIVPKYGMIFDADPVCEKFMTPHPEVTYLLASRCHHKVFEKLKDCKVIVWHAQGDKEIEDLLIKHNVYEPMINGGGAAVMRSMGLAIAMGYTNINLFGVDSSMTGDDTHIRKSLVPEKELEIFCHERWFKTTAWLASQANDFKILGPAFRDSGCKIVVYGDGLIPHIAAVLGFEVHGVSQPLEEIA